MHFRLTEGDQLIKSGKILASLFVLNFLFSLILLNVWYPEGQLPGPYDSWFNLSLCREWINTLSSHWEGIEPTYVFWPNRGLAAYSEPSPFLVPFYFIGTCFFPDPFDAYLCFIAILWSLNVVGVAVFARGILNAWLPAILCSIFFGWSNYFFSQIEHPNAFFWGFCFPALLCLESALRKERTKYWLAFAFLVILQAYSSTTVLTYLFVICVLLVISSWRYWFFSRRQWLKMLMTIGILLLLIYPLINFYLFSGFLKEAYNPAVHAGASVTSNLHFEDFFHASPGNLWLPSHPEFSFSLLARIRSAFPGLTLLIGFFWMILGSSTKVRELKGWVFLLGVSGFILSSGSELNIWGIHIPMPMKLFYDYAGDSTFLRTPIRAYFLMIMAFSLASAHVMASGNRLLSPLFVLLFLLESVPWTAKGVAGRNFSPEQKQIRAIRNVAAGAKVLHLPSSVLLGSPGKGVYPDWMSREYIYDYWQTAHQLNSINGFTGFLPYSRISIDRLLKEEKYDSLLINYSVGAVVWHKRFILKEEPVLPGKMLRGKRYQMKEFYSDSAITVYKIQRIGT